MSVMLAKAKTLVLSTTNPDSRKQKQIENPEYVHLCSDLKITNNALNKLHKRMKDNERHWRELCDKQKEFSDDFGKLFYENADLRHIGVQFSESSSAISDDIRGHFEKNGSPHLALKNRVLKRIQEIDQILARRTELRKLARARAKAKKALDKARAAHPALDAPSEELSTKESEYAEAEKTYNETLAAVMDTMKRLLADAHYTYACAFSEFCWVSTHASSIVEFSMRKMRPVADEAVKKLLGTDNSYKYYISVSEPTDNDAMDAHSPLSLN